MGSLVPVRDGAVVLPDWKSCWDASATHPSHQPRPPVAPASPSRPSSLPARPLVPCVPGTSVCGDLGVVGTIVLDLISSVHQSEANVTMSGFQITKIVGFQMFPGSQETNLD